MATIALAAATAAAVEGATVFVATAAVAAASTVGAYIDSQFVYPALGLVNEPQDVVGPRIDDFGLQTASWGAPMVYASGPSARIAGNIIWVSEVREVKTTHRSGGKGGSGANVTTYEYFVDVAVGLCEGVIQSLDKIVVEGRTIYEKDPDVSVTGTDISAQSSVSRRWAWMPSYMRTASGSGWVTYVFANYLYLSAPASGTDLSSLKTGQNATTSGFTNSVNNRTGNVSYVWKNIAGGTGCLIDMPLPSPNYPSAQPWGTLTTATTESAGNSVTVTQSALPKFDPAILTGGAPTVYTGSTTQTADSVIQAAEGAANVSAYRDTAYFVIEDLALGPFGNRIPQMGCIVTKDSTPYTVGDALDAHLARAGLQSAQYDTSLATDSLRGYAVPGPAATIRNIKPLVANFNLLTDEDGGVLTFRPRTSPQTAAIAADDAGARPAGERGPATIRLQDLAETRLPSEVNVDFLDADNDLQRGSAKYRKTEHVGDNVLSVDAPIVMTHDEAIDIARTRMWATHSNRRTFELTLPPSYFYLTEGYELTGVPLDDSLTVTALVLDVQVGLNGLVRCLCIEEESSVAEYV